MGSVEAQLAEYRARKAKERYVIQSSSTSGFGVLNLLRKRTTTQNLPAQTCQTGTDDNDKLAEKVNGSNIPVHVGGGCDGDGRTEQGDERESHAHSAVVSEQKNEEYKPSRLVSFIVGNYYISRIATYKHTSLILKVLLWLILWCLFIEIEFGAVYFVISLLYVIYATLRTGPRSGPSAYSVFNENFERLEGTFTAEEFDNQLRRGGGMM